MQPIAIVQGVGAIVDFGQKGMGHAEFSRQALEFKLNQLLHPA
jgi:hypothetical protein